MPEPLLHVSIPLFTMISCGVKPKKAALISLLDLLPDFDVLFMVHRSISHSVVFLLIFCIPIILVIKKFAPNHLSNAVLCTLVLLSHPIMDLFTGFTPIIWPLLNQSVSVTTIMMINFANPPCLQFNMAMEFSPVVFPAVTKFDAPIFTSNGIAVTSIFIAGMVLKKVKISLLEILARVHDSLKSLALTSSREQPYSGKSPSKEDAHA